MKVNLTHRYRISSDIIAREIEGELVIVPLKSGVGDLDAELYTLNPTGIRVWNMLDGTYRLDEVVEALSSEYDASYAEVKDDIVALIENLVERGLVVEA